MTPAAVVLGLEEALGVPELVAAVESLREVVTFVRESPRLRLELEASVHRLESDKARLSRELSLAEESSDERLSHLREEIQQLQAQVVELRRLEGTSGHIGKKMAMLESVVQQERDDKDRALLLVEELRKEVARLEKNLTSVNRDFVDIKSTTNQVSVKIFFIFCDCVH